jgi:hypothetical protein
LLDLITEHPGWSTAIVAVAMALALVAAAFGRRTGKRDERERTLQALHRHFGNVPDAKAAHFPISFIEAVGRRFEQDRAEIVDGKPFVQLKRALARDGTGTLPNQPYWLILPLRLSARRCLELPQKMAQPGAARVFAPNPAVATFLNDVADVLETGDPSTRQEQLVGLAQASDQRFDMLLMLALGLSSTRRDAIVQESADILFLAEAAVREAYAAFDIAIDRPRLFCPAEDASDGFAAEWRSAGARIMPELPPARAAVAAWRSTSPPDVDFVVEVTRFGLRQPRSLLRATSLALYNPAEWR